MEEVSGYCTAVWFQYEMLRESLNIKIYLSTTSIRFIAIIILVPSSGHQKIYICKFMFKFKSILKSIFVGRKKSLLTKWFSTECANEHSCKNSNA